MAQKLGLKTLRGTILKQMEAQMKISNVTRNIQVDYFDLYQSWSHINEQTVSFFSIESNFTQFLMPNF